MTQTDNYMKNLLYIACMILLVAAYGCSDWTDMENKNYDVTVRPDEYYEQLRAYKKSDHEVSFGWFGGWTGKGASLYLSLEGLPDSTDLVSIWGQAFPLDNERKKDLKYVQEVKGTRVMTCLILGSIGKGYTPPEINNNWKELGYETEIDCLKDYWGYSLDKGIDADVEQAIRRYANAICDTVYKYGYDGFDIDFEPGYISSGNLVLQNDRVEIFVEELGKRLGPMSGTGKLLVVDGEPQKMPSSVGKYFDYFIVQAYSYFAYPPGDKDLNKRLNSTVKNFASVMTAEEVARNYIVAEDFERAGYATNGGATNFEDLEGNVMPALIGMARWQPLIDGKTMRKGGIGTYHMEYEYNNLPEYKWLRQGIQIMNPAKQ